MRVLGLFIIVKGWPLFLGVDFFSLSESSWACFSKSFPCRSLFDWHQTWSARFFFIYANVETKQDHVRVVSFTYSLVGVVSFAYYLVGIVSFAYSLVEVVSFTYYLVGVVSFAYYLVRVINFAYSLVRVISFAYYLVRVVNFVGLKISLS